MSDSTEEPRATDLVGIATLLVGMIANVPWVEDIHEGSIVGLPVAVESVCPPVKWQADAEMNQLGCVVEETPDARRVGYGDVQRRQAWQSLKETGRPPVPPIRAWVVDVRIEPDAARGSFGDKVLVSIA